MRHHFDMNAQFLAMEGAIIFLSGPTNMAMVRQLIFQKDTPKRKTVHKRAHPKDRLRLHTVLL